jgi:hypothetical protein
MSGIYAEKALVQHLRECFHYTKRHDKFILNNKMDMWAQILHTRGFDGYVPDMNRGGKKKLLVFLLP